MKHFFKQIHLWLSVPFGIVITLVCFSGAMLVFEPEITQTVCADKLLVKNVGDTPLPIDAVAGKVARTLPDGVRVTDVTVSRDPREAYRVNLSKPRRAAVYVDQYTGEIKGRYERPAFFATMFKLHRWLLDTGRPDGRPAWGKIVVGVSTIMFVIALVSGVVIWWPKTRRALRNSLKITVGKGKLRFWHSLHVAGGMYAVVLLLAMALTGLTWSFQWYRSAFYAVFGVKDTAGSGNNAAKGSNSDKKHHKGKGGQRGGKTAGSAVWQQVYDRLHADNPHAKTITVGDGTASVQHSGLGNSRAADRYTFDKRSGRITSMEKYEDTPPSGKLRGWIYSVHVGAFGGLFTRILWFLAALLGASLPLTGYYLWVKRLMRKHGRASSGGKDTAQPAHRTANTE